MNIRPLCEFRRPIFNINYNSENLFFNSSILKINFSISIHIKIRYLYIYIYICICDFFAKLNF